LYNEILSSKEESKESDEDENNSDIDHDMVKKSMDESQKRNGTNLIEINESFIHQKDNLVYFINPQRCPRVTNMVNIIRK